ncbi:MAG: hypothetical protein IJK91_03570 [Bacteroidales bacterium]|nr:hypothetical protein [Bacteroidales bacterium]
MKKLSTLFLVTAIAVLAAVSCTKPGEEGGEGGSSSKDFKDKYDIYEGVEAVDLGLPSGIKWARCNLGASKPWEVGDFFAWGETSPKTEFTLANYKFMSTVQSGWHPTKYNRYKFSTLRDDKYALEAEDDAATVILGNEWYVPSPADFEELKQSCEVEFVSVQDVYCFKYTGPNGNAILFPCGGQWEIARDKTEAENGYVKQGFYWTNVFGMVDERDKFAQEEAVAWWINGNGSFLKNNTYRMYRPSGLNIRPVSGGKRY